VLEGAVFAPPRGRDMRGEGATGGKKRKDGEAILGSTTISYFISH
jgi:hypothetical protein